MSSNGNCCDYPQLVLRTEADRRMQMEYCPLAQQAYKDPVESMVFEGYSKGCTRCVGGSGDRFNTLNKGYNISITSPLVEGYCGCPSNMINRMPRTIVENYTSNCPAKNMNKNRPRFPGVL